MAKTWWKSGSWNAICSFCKKETNNYTIHSNGKLRKQCEDCRKAKNKLWAINHKKQRNESAKKYRLLNPEIYKQRVRDWRINNLEYDAFRSSYRKAMQKQAIPKWANIEKIKELYLNCPKGYHVDHIVPLQGKTVSGLHVENNLQYLPAMENWKKRNLYWEGM